MDGNGGRCRKDRGGAVVVGLDEMLIMPGTAAAEGSEDERNCSIRQPAESQE